MRPDDANVAGNVHGGTILKMIEEAGAIISTRHCNSQDGVSVCGPLSQPAGIVGGVHTPGPGAPLCSAGKESSGAQAWSLTLPHPQSWGLPVAPARSALVGTPCSGTWFWAQRGGTGNYQRLSRLSAPPPPFWERFSAVPPPSPHRATLVPGSTALGLALPALPDAWVAVGACEAQQALNTHLRRCQLSAAGIRPGLLL